MAVSSAKQHLIKIYIVLAPGGGLTLIGAVHLMWVNHNFPPGQAGFIGGVNKIGHPSKNSRSMAGRQKPLAYQNSTFFNLCCPLFGDIHQFFRHIQAASIDTISR